MNREVLLSNKFYEILYESKHQKVHSKFYPKQLFDVFLVSPDERKSAAQDYSDWMRNEYMFIGNYSSDVLLYEDFAGPSLERLKRRLKKNYKIKDWQLDVTKFCNDVEGYYAKRLLKSEVPICIPNIKKNREIIINVFDQEGYYLINETPSKFDDWSHASWISMIFAPKEQKNIFYWIKDTPYIYHTTLAKNVDDILKNGLVPHESDRTFKYRPRTYFFIQEDKYKSYQYGEELYRLRPEEGSEYALIKVDVSSLPENSHFYFDPMIDSAVFTVDVIEPSHISDVEKFDVESIDVDDTYVPTQRELENQEKAYEIIKQYQKEHPSIKHNHQFVSASFKNSNELRELWKLLNLNGIYCSPFGKVQDGYVIMMDFRKY